MNTTAYIITPEALCAWVDRMIAKLGKASSAALLMGVDESLISRWRRGEVVPSLAQVAALSVLAKEPGLWAYLAREAGGEAALSEADKELRVIAAVAAGKFRGADLAQLAAMTEAVNGQA